MFNFVPLFCGNNILQKFPFWVALIENRINKRFRTIVLSFMLPKIEDFCKSKSVPHFLSIFAHYAPNPKDFRYVVAKRFVSLIPSEKAAL